MEATRDDVLAMLKAMNPDWAAAAEGPLSHALDEMRQRHGEHAAKSPFLALVKFGDEGGAGGPPPFAIVVPSDNYKGTLAELNGGKEPELKHQDGDYDEFAGPDGNGTWYAAKAPGVVAFGPSKEMIAEIAKRPVTVARLRADRTDVADVLPRRRRRLRERRLAHQAIRRPDRAGPPDDHGRHRPGRAAAGRATPRRWRWPRTCTASCSTRSSTPTT